MAHPLAEAFNEDCWLYARHVLPDFMFGQIHKEIFTEMSNPQRHETSPNLLALIPRDHLKSVMLATYATWRIARNPAYTILYITADEDLGRLQMSFMKDIFDSDEFREVYPDHFLPSEGRRDKWTGMALNVDHPQRRRQKVRDETIAVKTIKSGKTGRHPDEIMYDDLVVPENAYTELGRGEVRQGAAQAVSLAKSNALMTAVGTVYHPMDQYALWMDAQYPRYDDKGEYLGEQPLWRSIVHKVESSGNGTGIYLWPRTYSRSLKQWYGWDIGTISKKKAEYLGNGQAAAFYSQYYMEANDPSSHRLGQDQFKYMNLNRLVRKDGQWFYEDRPLTIGCFMDVAVTDAASRNATKADHTAMGVIGQCNEGQYYILALEMFQTDKRLVYYEYLCKLWKYWGFKTVDIELENAGKILAGAIRELLAKDGYSLLVTGDPPPRGISKFERHAAITIPKYQQGLVWHTQGGYTPMLEEQVIKERPANDDLLDVVTAGLEKLKKPMRRAWMVDSSNETVIAASDRFGGRVR